MAIYDLRTPSLPTPPVTTSDVLNNTFSFFTHDTASTIILTLPIWVWIFFWLKRKDDRNWKLRVSTLLLLTVIWLGGVFWIDKFYFFSFMQSISKALDFRFNQQVAYAQYILPGLALLIGAYIYFNSNKKIKK